MRPQTPGWLGPVALVLAGLAGATTPAQQPTPAASRPPQTPSRAEAGLAAAPQSARNANYSIDARLDTDRRVLTGREVLTWRNISPITTTELQFHLYYNAWRNTRSTWMQERLLGRGSALHGRPEADWGWIDVTAIRLVGEGDAPPIDLNDAMTFISPDDGNPDDRTVMAVALPRAISPGDTVNIEIEWTSRIPRTFARTGTIGNYYFIAQWFPKIGVLEKTGWNCHQFHTATEFYADYGMYDVRLTVPAGWVVGATGVEREVRDNGDGTATHRYVQADVHDFAWTTSPDFVERTEVFDHPTLPRVRMRLLLQPEHLDQAARHFEATRQTLRYYGEWFGAYPYEQLTIVDPAWQSGSGGMEYPTFFTAGTRWLAPAAVSTPENVTVHEAGHQFWYGLVGNNEFEHAWLDEGLNTFGTARVLEQYFSPHYRSTRFFGGFVPWVFDGIPWSREVDGNRLRGYRRDARMDAQSTPSFRYWPGSAVSMSYDKTALWLHTLERHLGWPVLQSGMTAFFEEFRFGHPRPDDFFRSLSNASNQDLGWFFDQVHGAARVFDYGVQELSSRPVSGRGLFETDEGFTFEEGHTGPPYETTVVVRRYGDGVFPVEVLTVFDDGHEIRERWDGDGAWTAYRYVRDARAARATVDPERVLLLDVDHTNNSRLRMPQAAAAADKWSLVWLVWLQDLLLTYGFFL